ncbi:DUF6591 domain-containing protein [Hominenteromicrobium sp.]|jgi:conserved uncharacterized protein|uniref:DUF6591 domain-containing protein n=1 Tax=Hominenteromicrobium sp. TaxID=3073581 RepID=UPI003AB60370
MEMKCSHCGAEYEGNFCPECGARAESQSPATPPPIQQPAANRQNPVPPVGGNVAAYQKPKKPKKPIYKKWWFYVIAAVALIAIISAISGGKGKGEKIEWSKIELRDQLPEPPSNRGTLFENSDEEFWVSLDGVSDDQYNDYLDACVDKGFTVDADKSSYSYKAYNADGYSLDMSHIGDGLSITLKAPMNFGSITWPSSTVGNMLPAPKSTTGKFSYEHDDSFFVYVGETSKADYDQYVADCSANGFNIDYDKGDTYYRADNADGYHISLKYEGNNIMAVEIKASKNSDTGTSEPATTEPSTETTAPSESSSTETKPNDTELVDGMRKDFKDAMDSYEAFMDEYVAFMKKYSDNPSDVGLLADYTKYMSKYADMVEKFDKWESEDLNDAELAYYIDVQARVSKKLLDVAG